MIVVRSATNQLKSLWQTSQNSGIAGETACATLGCSNLRSLVGQAFSLPDFCHRLLKI